VNPFGGSRPLHAHVAYDNVVVWAFVSSTALAISGIGPSYRADGVTALLLFGLHFVTAVVVISGCMRTLPVRGHVAVNDT